jgi:hypothetical protein
MSAVLPSSTNAAPAPQRSEAASTAGAAKPVTVVAAVERLALSREQLRTAMLPKRRTSGKADAQGGAGAVASSLTDRLKAIPGAPVLLDAVKTWWAQHPLRMATSLAAEASRKFAGPIAERNPLALVFGAVLLGALIALTRPWRWLLRPALFAGLIPALAARAIRELPIDSLLRIFSPGTQSAAVKPSAPTAARSVAASPADKGTGL